MAVNWSLQSPLHSISVAAKILLGHRDIWIKRDDALHPTVSGNKFRKLKFLSNEITHLKTPRKLPYLVTMGGIWSNHLHATAFVSKLLGCSSIGLVRGDSFMSFTATLQDCRMQGMELIFIDRINYRKLRDADVINQEVQLQIHLKKSLSLSREEGKDQNIIWIPEGGSTPLSLSGVAELVKELPFAPDSIVVCVCVCHHIIIIIIY